MIVITTPTGDIGRHLLARLLERAPAHGEDLRVVVRDPARLPDGARDRVDVVVGSHGDPDVVDRAFDGADAVFWVVPPDPRANSVDDAFSGFTRPAARAIATHGVGHVVGVSAAGRGTDAAAHAGLITASLAVDDLLAGTGTAYRALANGYFMENVSRQADAVRDRGVFLGAMEADRPLPVVAARDIAATAAGLLLDRTWTGTAEVALLGPEDLTPDDMAAVMTTVLGTTVRYERQSLDDLAAALGARGASAGFVAGMVDMMTAGSRGLHDLAVRVPGVAPTTFRGWCADVLAPSVLAPTTTAGGTP